MGRRFSASGAPIGAEFQVNVYTPGGQYSPSVAADASGNFIVTWVAHLQDGSSHGVFGRRFTATAVPRSPEFRVNTYTTEHQWFPVMAVDPVGNFLVAWDSLRQDGSPADLTRRDTEAWFVRAARHRTARKASSSRARRWACARPG